MEKEHDDKALTYIVMGVGFLIYLLIFPPFTITKYKYWFWPYVENFFPGREAISDLLKYKIRNLWEGIIPTIFGIAVVYYNPEKIFPPVKIFLRVFLNVNVLSIMSIAMYYKVIHLTPSPTIHLSFSIMFFFIYNTYELIFAFFVKK